MDAAPEPKPTPMMAQYLEIKAVNPDCLLFYRMGDFYEMFFEDAEIASQALGIVLTKRGKHLGDDIPMCGVPVERADDYLQKLIALGHRVAVCEQIEDPAEAKKRGAKSVVKRDVVRLVTPGTITEERLLEPGRPNALLAVARVKADGRAVYGLASVDISTGAVSLGETDETGLAPEIARAEPREIVAPQALCEETGFARLLAEMKLQPTPMGRDSGDSAAQIRRVQGFYGVETLEGFGAFSRAEIAACALALAYVERTQLHNKPDLAPPQRHHPPPQVQRLVELVGHEDHGDLLLPPDGEEFVGERGAGGVVQSAERLVEQQQPGLNRQGAGQTHPLALPTREFMNPPTPVARQPDEPQRLLDPRRALGAAQPFEPERHVARHRQPGKERRLLLHERQRRVRPLHHVAAEPDLALLRAQKAGEQ